MPNNVEALRTILLNYGANHKHPCPQRQQNYWRMRPEYRPRGYGDDKRCVCGLDVILGKHDDRAMN